MAESLEELLLIMVLSSWLNVALYTLELVLCWRYFTRPSRPLIHKIGVAVLVFFDSVCTVAGGVGVCLAVVRSPITNLRLLLSPLATQIFTTYVSAVISQLFLSNLFYVLTGNKIVTGILLILIFVHLGFSWASAISSLTTLNLGGITFTTTTVGAVSCAATDLIIAASLSWKFWTMMARTNRETSSRSLLRRILILTVSSGAICASNTLVMMILLLKGSDFFEFFFSCQGRVYALTILGNFLVGIPARSQDETQHLDNSNSNFSSNIVVFRSMAVETTVSPIDAPKSSDQLRSKSTRRTPRMSPYATAETADSVQLDDLAFERITKTDLEREDYSSV
ncbi:hypothetical protein MVEN_01834100 [Mycena venus]|uniref:DUF6534 domain-containing protein n=1 Tax=Mycena venus TaxID=2733690 RepID=A0A8H6XKS1_9AGAR|nr:hypothetical protein MVEN_01834100 [Mycena venus]